MADNEQHVIVEVGDRWATILAPAGERARVAAALAGVVDDPKRELRTVTAVRYGLGLRVPARYADQVHAVLFDATDLEVHAELLDTTEGQGTAVDEQPRSGRDGATDGPAGGDGTSTPTVGEPPRSGRGSGEGAWRTFLDGQGVTYPEGANRDELVALWDAQQ